MDRDDVIAALRLVGRALLWLLRSVVQVAGWCISALLMLFVGALTGSAKSVSRANRLSIRDMARRRR